MFGDDSYSQDSYRRDCFSLNHKHDIIDIKKKDSYEGIRICYFAPSRGCRPTTLLGIIPGAGWMFCLQAANDHFIDYHKLFNSRNYFFWFMNQLSAYLIRPNIIIRKSPSNQKNSHLKHQYLWKRKILKHMPRCVSMVHTMHHL